MATARTRSTIATCPAPPTPAADPEVPEAWEAQLLSRITGERNVAEPIALAGNPAYMVVAALAALLGLEVIEKREG